VAGTRLHHHLVSAEFVTCKPTVEWLRPCWRERDRLIVKLHNHTV
jgi:hypothetical protein